MLIAINEATHTVSDTDTTAWNCTVHTETFSNQGKRKGAVLTAARNSVLLTSCQVVWSVCWFCSRGSGLLLDVLEVSYYEDYATHLPSRTGNILKKSSHSLRVSVQNQEKYLQCEENEKIVCFELVKINLSAIKLVVRSKIGSGLSFGSAANWTCTKYGREEVRFLQTANTAATAWVPVTFNSIHQSSLQLVAVCD